MARYIVGFVVGVVVATAVGAHAMTVEEALTRTAAVQHGIDPDWLANTVRCESGFDRYARNGQYLGMGQLGPSERGTFYARGYDNVWDPAQVACYMAERFREGGAGAWSCA